MLRLTFCDRFSQFVSRARCEQLNRKCLNPLGANDGVQLVLKCTFSVREEKKPLSVKLRIIKRESNRQLREVMKSIRVRVARRTHADFTVLFRSSHFTLNNRHPLTVFFTRKLKTRRFNLSNNHLVFHTSSFTIFC